MWLARYDEGRKARRQNASRERVRHGFNMTLDDLDTLAGWLADHFRR